MHGGAARGGVSPGAWGQGPQGNPKNFFFFFDFPGGGVTLSLPLILEGRKSDLKGTSGLLESSRLWDCGTTVSLRSGDNGTEPGNRNIPAPSHCQTSGSATGFFFSSL